MFFGKCVIKISFVVMCAGCLFLGHTTALGLLVNGERSIVVVIPSYNNARWYKQNLDSIFVQDYSNYKIIYTDDCSRDNTHELVKRYVEERGFQDKVVLIGNQVRKGALENQYNMTYMCKDDDIVLFLDADDWLAHHGVFKLLNSIYADSNIWMTYGQFQIFPSGEKGWCYQYSREIIEQNGFRKAHQAPSHLRTFYAGLFKQIKLKDLYYQGRFFQMTGDRAVMFPLIEMARYHVKFIPEVLYIYNMSNEINDHKVDGGLQVNLDVHYIRKLKPYDAVPSPFLSVQ